MARAAKTTGQDILKDAGRKIAGRLLDWRCPCCERRIDLSACKRRQLQMDHWVPCAAGGHELIEGNLVVLCGQCNATKQDRVDHLAVDGWIVKALNKARGKGRELTPKGATRAAKNAHARITAARDALTSKLVEVGVWDAETVENNRAALAAM
jgi:hypothetical protein